MDSEGKRWAGWLVLGQFAASVLIGGGLLAAAGPVQAYSALVGGLTAAVANGFLASRVFADYRAQDPQRLLLRWYGAELMKLALVGALLAAAFVWIEPLSVGALFGAFLVIHLIPSVLAAAG